VMAHNTNAVHNIDGKVELENHLVVIGYGLFGKEVVQKINNSGIAYHVLESDLNLVELGVSQSENVIFANAVQEETLKMAKIEE
ncbi:NAD-binding protein, partial [Campylobacter jejuni]|uniref:NAD-binding protein n=1 Tax=Campylobacter jejuni TaxID=197 RepID=UPI0018F885A0